MSGVKLELSGFSKWRVVKQGHQTRKRIGRNQGYLQKKTWKSKTQENRTDGKVTISALFA